MKMMPEFDPHQYDECYTGGFGAIFWRSKEPGKRSVWRCNWMAEYTFEAVMDDFGNLVQIGGTLAPLPRR